MNDIPARQNSPQMMTLLRARKRIYREADHRQLLQLFLTLLLPIAGAVLGLVEPKARPYVGVAAFLITVLDVWWIDRSLRARLKTAARISELFDSEVMSLPWNKFVAGSQIDMELVAGAARRWKKGDSKLVDWYPVAVGELPLAIARIVCQRTNLWYNGEVRRRYTLTLSGLVFLAVVLLAAGGAYVNLPFVDWAATLLLPAAPLLIWAGRDYFRQSDAATALERLKDDASGLFQLSISGGVDDEQLAIRSREFQDAIFNRRVADPLVPFLYPLLRSGLEFQMNEGAEAMIERYRRAQDSVG
jgi:hypothetical protein